MKIKYYWIWWKERYYDLKSDIYALLLRRNEIKWNSIMSWCILANDQLLILKAWRFNVSLQLCNVCELMKVYTTCARVTGNVIRKEKKECIYFLVVLWSWSNYALCDVFRRIQSPYNKLGNTAPRGWVGGEEIVGLQIASVSRVRNFSGRIVARSFHNACRAARNALYHAAASLDVLIRCERAVSR